MSITSSVAMTSLFSVIVVPSSVMSDPAPAALTTLLTVSAPPAVTVMEPLAVVTGLRLPSEMASVSVIVRLPAPEMAASRELTAVLRSTPVTAASVRRSPLTRPGPAMPLVVAVSVMSSAAETAATTLIEPALRLTSDPAPLAMTALLTTIPPPVVMEMEPPAVVTSLALPRVMSLVSLIERAPMPVMVASRVATAVLRAAPAEASLRRLPPTVPAPVMVLPAAESVTLLGPPAVRFLATLMLPLAVTEMAPFLVVTSLTLPRVMSLVSVIERVPIPVMVASRLVTSVARGETLSASSVKMPPEVTVLRPVVWTSIAAAEAAFVLVFADRSASPVASMCPSLVNLMPPSRA